MQNKMINILLVEDNTINQLIAAKFLKLWGMDVMIANHGREALSMIGSKAFHLVLMDLEMPEMDGYESTRRIREMNDSYFKTIPIIAFSASDIGDARGKAIDSGMTALVTKPLQQEELQSTIDKYVSANTKNDVGLRPLSIDFDQYTDGDATFKKELVSLIMVDIDEVQKALKDAVQLNDPDVFFKGCHKAKTTINMVNDPDVIRLLEELKVQMTDANHRSAAFEAQILQFNGLCEDLLMSLSSLIQ